MLHLPHHLSPALLEPPARAEARRDLGLPADALIVTAPGLATAAKGLDVGSARARLACAARHPRLLFVVAGDGDPRLPLQERARAAGMA